MNVQDAWSNINSQTKIVTTLVALNCFFYLATLYLSSVLGSYNGSLIILGGMYTPAFLNGDVGSLIISAFLHGGAFHLILNMIALWSLGGFVERFYGGKKLFIVYIFCAISSSLISFGFALLTAYLGKSYESNYVTIGASGSIFGIIGLILGNRWKKNTYSVSMDNYIDTVLLSSYVVYNLVIGFGINIVGNGLSIDNFGHLGGLLGGIVLGLVLDPINTFYQSKAKYFFEKLLFLISVLLFIISIIAHILFLFIGI